MRFGIEKCAILILKRGLVTKSEGIPLPDESIIQALREGEGYKYLGVLEASDVLHDQMKQNISKEYLRWVRKIAQWKLNGVSLIKAINTCFTCQVCVWGWIVEWRKQDLWGLDIRTKKLLTINGRFHPRDYVPHVYVPRAERGRGLSSVEDCIEQARKSLEKCVQNSKEKLVFSPGEKVLENVETSEAFKARCKAESVSNWQDKSLHG